MNSFLTLSELIGCKIEAIRCHYIEENEYGQQMFFSYLKLSNGFVISIPMFDEENFLELSDTNLQYLQKEFITGDEFSKPLKNLMLGTTIEDLFFCYFNNRIVGDERAYIKLNNNHYLTEINFGPPGVAIGLTLLNKQEFIENIKNCEQEIKSYLGLKGNR